ncbi:MAG TPA: dihydrofolate reductase family protein [Micromonosporaceae bacterium]|nr:dihydrofolate reductase family protein [Micromonosporaceae bacterium]
MGKVTTGASMSVDGYISGPNESGFEHLFRWYNNGDVVIETTNPELTMHMTDVGAKHVRDTNERLGAIVCGRKLFDYTNGWGGQHPMGVPVVVVTHSVPDGWDREGEWFTFVTDGIEAAIARAREIAGDKEVGLNGGTIASQCLELGLLDEIWVDLVPVVLGGGTRFFDQLTNVPVELEGPTVVEDKDVTHLKYTVRKRA